MEWTITMAEIWRGLLLPLGRITLFVALGLLAASLIEELGWNRALSRVAAPFIRFGRFSETAGSGFALAFVSGVSSNTLLSEAYQQGRMSRRELVLANLLNSMPRFFLHMPTVFFLIAPLIKGAAVVYVGLTFSAALLRTLVITIAGRLLLPLHCQGDACQALAAGIGAKPDGIRNWWAALDKAGRRLRKRLGRIMMITAPIYALFFLAGRAGWFARLTEGMAGWFGAVEWLRPESISIIVLQAASEFTVGVAAAGALLDGGALTIREVVLALLVGTVLSSPLQALRHQLPYYAGIFPPRLAAWLIVCGQLFRIVSIMLVGVGYFVLSS